MMNTPPPYMKENFIACSLGWTQPNCNKNSRRLNFSRTFLDAQEEVTESTTEAVFLVMCDPSVNEL
jgi:hypothetical protein